MKILFLTDAYDKTSKKPDDEYWEEAILERNETPRQCAQRIVDYFNASLKPGERLRKVLGVKMAPIDIKEKS